MKKILLAFTLILGYTHSYSQCTPDPQYQDSTYAIWPDTVDNLPLVYQSQNYSTILTIKTPSTLIEAVGGDVSLVTIPLIGYVGDWPVDSMQLLGVTGLPSGFMYECEIANCIIPGNTLSCALLSGNTNDPIGIYPLVMDVQVYTHGLVGGFIPLDTSVIEQITGYNIVVSNTSSFEMFNSNEFTLFQNIPNPTKNNPTTIRFNTPNSNMIKFMITDMFGKVVYSENVKSDIGLNTIEFNNKLSSGVYTYSVQNKERIISKRMIISE